MIVTLTNIEWKELPTKSGKTSTGYELSIEGRQPIKVYDFVIKNKPGLKQALKALEKADLPAKVEMHFIEENGFKALNDIFTVDGQMSDVGAATSKPKAAKSYVSDTDRQSSIERQNALTNAINLVVGLRDNFGTLDHFDTAVLNVKTIAKELLEFTQGGVI